MELFFSLDRKIGDKAVLIDDNGKPLDAPLDMLPKGCREGDVFTYINGRFVYSEQVTKERRKIMAETLAMLLKKGDDGE